MERQSASKEAGHYDWCLGYSLLKPALEPYMRTTDSILMVGCGNSSKDQQDTAVDLVGLSEDLYEGGFTQIHNIDYSASVIELMGAKTQDACPSMQWSVMDMRDLGAFPSDSFDVVMDKCAMDAIWSDGGSLWDPEDQTKADIGACVAEFHRVVKPGGTFIFISFGQPHFRKPLLVTPGWAVETIPIGMFFMYVMKKAQV